MFGWLFKKKEPENYEALLASLASDIGERRARLADIRQRQRRATLWLTVYAGAAWALYVALWYATLLPNVRREGDRAFDKVLKGAPVLVGPILILSARQIMQAWYTRIGNAEETTLKKLTVKQRETIDDIKKKTNYYSTRNLLERYDDTGPGTPRKPIPASPQVPGAIPPTPQRQLPAGVNVPQIHTTPARPGARQSLGAAPPGVSLLSPVQQPILPARRMWYDRLADAVLGDDAEAPASKYALICARCFAHNGLVKEEDWAKTKYTCPKCGFFNDAPGPKQQANGAAQPGVVATSTSSPAQAASVTSTPPVAAQRTQPHVRSPLAKTEESEESEVEGDVTRMDVDDL